MDKALIANRFALARHTYEQEATVQRKAAAHMADALAHAIDTLHTGPLHRVAETGCGTGIFSRMLMQRFHPRTLMLNDLCPEMEDALADLLHPSASTTEDTVVSFSPGDAERMPLPDSCNLVASCSTVQWFDDLPAFLRRAWTATVDGGLLAFSTFGAKNLHEIRGLTGHGLRYPSLSILCAWMEDAGYRVTLAEEQIATLTFATPHDVLRHLKQTGVTGTEKCIWTRGRLQQFETDYRTHYSLADGTVTLTYHPYYLIGQKTHTPQFHI